MRTRPCRAPAPPRETAPWPVTIWQSCPATLPRRLCRHYDDIHGPNLARGWAQKADGRTNAVGHRPRNAAQRGWVGFGLSCQRLRESSSLNALFGSLCSVGLFSCEFGVVAAGITPHSGFCACDGLAIFSLKRVLQNTFSTHTHTPTPTHTHTDARTLAVWGKRALKCPQIYTYARSRTVTAVIEVIAVWPAIFEQCGAVPSLELVERCALIAGVRLLWLPNRYRPQHMSRQKGRKEDRQ